MSSMDGGAESIASSAFSTISTRNQIDKCKDVLMKALNFKKIVSTPRLLQVKLFIKNKP